MAAAVAIVLHERLGNWSRRLRPRFHDRKVRWFETRSTADLEAAVAGRSAPIAVVDLTDRPADRVGAVDRIRTLAPGGLILALDPLGLEEVAELARDLGADHVFSGAAPPPEVARLLDRWIDLAARRAARAGWSRSDDLDDPLEPWGRLIPGFQGTP